MQKFIVYKCFYSGKYYWPKRMEKPKLNCLKLGLSCYKMDSRSSISFLKNVEDPDRKTTLHFSKWCEI